MKRYVQKVFSVKCPVTWENFHLEKRQDSKFPLWNIFVSVSTHIKKSIVENVGNSTGIVNRFATFLKGGNIVSFNFTDVYD